MHLFACEHPKRIHNPYTDTDMFVPCGECDICRAKRSLSWVERLEVERSCHPYCLFGTLTYSEKFLPRFDFCEDGFVDASTGELVLLKDIPYEYLDNDSVSYINSRGCLPVGSVKDCQNFIKRLRSRVRSNPSDERSSDRYLRYFLVEELGETTFRPHYHFIIFTASKWFAEHAKDVVTSCWSTDNRNSNSEKLGIVDVQNVQSSATSYVAGYVNSVVSCPSIYKYRRFKPFCLFSKSPSIGSLLSDSAEIQELFDSGSCKMSVFRRKTNEYVSVPVSKALCDRLYPKIVRFSSLPDHVISGIYALSDHFPWISFGDFEEFIRRRSFEVFDGVSEYLRFILENLTDSKSCLHRLYTVLNRVGLQSRLFGVSPQKYADRIISFYKSVDYECLCSQLECEVNISETNDSRFCLLSDMVLFDNIMSEGADFTYSQVRLFKSYGYDENTLSKLDLVSEISFDEILDYKQLRSNCSKIVNEHRKKVAKNEYLEHRSKDRLFINFLKSYHGL